MFIPSQQVVQHDAISLRQSTITATYVMSAATVKCTAVFM